MGNEDVDRLILPSSKEIQMIELVRGIPGMERVMEPPYVENYCYLLLLKVHGRLIILQEWRL